MKWASYHSFIQTVHDLGYSRRLAYCTAAILPVLELLTAISLFEKSTVLIGELVLIAMLLFSCSLQ